MGGPRAGHMVLTRFIKRGEGEGGREGEGERDTTFCYHCSRVWALPYAAVCGTNTHVMQDGECRGYEYTCHAGW